MKDYRELFWQEVIGYVGNKMFHVKHAVVCSREKGVKTLNANKLYFAENSCRIKKNCIGEGPCNRSQLLNDT